MQKKQLGFLTLIEVLIVVALVIGVMGLSVHVIEMRAHGSPAYKFRVDVESIAAAVRTAQENNPHGADEWFSQSTTPHPTGGLRLEGAGAFAVAEQLSDRFDVDVANGVFGLSPINGSPFELRLEEQEIGSGERPGIVIATSVTGPTDAKSVAETLRGRDFKVTPAIESDAPDDTNYRFAIAVNERYI